MSNPGVPHIADVLATCQAGADEAAAAISRIFGRAVSLSVGEAATLSFGTKLGACQGPGLLLVIGLGQAAAAVAIPDSAGLSPAWSNELDASGRSRLAALAQELGMILLADAASSDDFTAGRVDDLAAALARGGATADAPLISLMLGGEGAPGGTAALVWPLPRKTAIFPQPKVETAPAAPASAPPLCKSKTVGAAIDQLPGYSKSLLHIEVPLQVILAATKQQIGRIVELGPGSIIHFDKSCDETLDLCVCGHRVARGEAVKVGDKFGIRITSLTLPEERFTPARLS